MESNEEEEEVVIVVLCCRTCGAEVKTENFRSSVELTKKIGILCGKCKTAALLRILWG